MDELVQKLSEGNHPVEITLRPEKTVENFKACLDRRYVHVKFTGTRGGTELGVEIDEAASDFTQADFEKGSGSVRLIGRLNLNYVPVRCVATVNLETLEGEGHLEILEQPAPQESAALN